MSNFLNIIKDHKTNDVTKIEVWGVDFRINPLTFGETLAISKVLTGDGNEAEQSIHLIGSMVTDPDGNYLFATDEGKDVLKSKTLSEVKILLDKCMEVAQFDLDKKVENEVKN